MAVELNDSTPPNIVINHFYWNSNIDNNIYINPANDKLEGHIELKYYLGKGFTDVNYGTEDYKIFGKVVFSGYAYDNKSLSSLNWYAKETKNNEPLELGHRSLLHQ